MTTTTKSSPPPTEFTIDLKPDAEIAKGITNAKKKIKTLKVTTAEECVAASKVLADVAKLRRACVARYKDRKAPVLNVSRIIDANRNDALETIASLEASVAAMIKRFRATEAQARAAVEEQMRKQQEAEAQQRRQQQVEHIKAAAASATDDNVRALLEKQAEVVANAHTIIEPIEPIEEPKTLADGVHERENAHAVVASLRKLVLQVAATMMLQATSTDDPAVVSFLYQFNPSDQATLDCLQPAMPHLNKLAKNIGAADLKLEGVSVSTDSTFVAR